MMYLWSFLVGGLICAGAQVVIDKTSYTQGHVLSTLTVVGGILGGLGLYERFIEKVGAGATVPIASFGNALVQGALLHARTKGVVGLLTGMFELTSAGITAAVVFAFLTALVFAPKG